MMEILEREGFIDTRGDPTTEKVVGTLAESLAKAWEALNKMQDSRCS